MIGSITHINPPSPSVTRLGAGAAELRQEIREAQPLGQTARVLSAARDLAALGPGHHAEAAREVTVALGNRRIAPERYVHGAEVLAGMGSRFHPEAARWLWRYIEAAPSRADSVLGLRALLVLGDVHYEEGLRRYPDLARLPVVRPGRGGRFEEFRLLVQRAEADRGSAGRTARSSAERWRRWRETGSLRSSVVRSIQEHRPDWPTLLRCAILDPGYRKRLVGHTNYALRAYAGLRTEDDARRDHAWAALILAHAGPAFQESAIPALRACLADYALDADLYVHAALSLADQDPSYRDEAGGAVRRLMGDATVATADRITASSALTVLEPGSTPEVVAMLRELVVTREGTAADWTVAADILADHGGTFREEAGALLRAVIADGALSISDRAVAAEGLLTLGALPGTTHAGIHRPA